MNKLLITLLLYLFSPLALAATGSLSFTPPASDLSVFFLANLFGIVDGVLTAGSGLQGTGSQIMGSMFLVFNSAVLALGGIIIMYTLIVSTMNTAHEGQMLGQKWSSIWIPIRSTIGLGLLIPKASGYCLMQVFVMWIVIQGVGAADKVWDAALGYLNRGGVIIQAQATNPSAVLLSSTAFGVSAGAAEILKGQACMLALEKQLAAKRQDYLDRTQNDKGPCTSNELKDFCDTPVPDFLSSVNAVDLQNSSPDSEGDYNLAMPNFSSEKEKLYSQLNGICGTITWAPIAGFNAKSKDATQLAQQQYFKKEFSGDDYKTAQLSRAIAIQQMYVDLSLIARIMVSNDPQIGTAPKNPPDKKASDYATEQFGVPLTAAGKFCSSYPNNCTAWGANVADVGVLFNGREFQAAINDYNGVMRPTLNALNKARNPSDQARDQASRAFIKNASASGWIMAGAYFFDLVKLNSEMSRTTPETVDTSSGLQKSLVDLNELTVTKRPVLGRIFGVKDVDTYISPIKNLLFGGIDTQEMPNFKKADTNRATIPRQQGSADGGASTVYGFINNSLNVRLPGQVQEPLRFADTLTFSPAGKPWDNVQPKDFNCNDGKSSVTFNFDWPLGDVTVCFAWLLEILWNGIIVTLANVIADFIYTVIQTALNVILWVPLQLIALVFKQGVATISTPGVNPVVALANMGVMYINFAGNLWITLLISQVVLFIVPPVFAILMLAAPLIMGWMAIMVGISFVTAYYIPILPYMMFIFGAVGWLVSVIEAMVAAPLVALGITHPEGDQAFGKGEHAIMILLNVFLRPAMMIIGYVAAIALTYVSVWLLNAGFDHAISYMQGGPNQASFSVVPAAAKGSDWAVWSQAINPEGDRSGSGSGSGATQYTGWAGLFAFFFSILTYTTTYLILVQKAFGLISILPDKVLRWIGGPAEQIGQESAQWGEEAKGATKEAGGKSSEAAGQIGKQAAAGAIKAPAELKKLKHRMQADIKASQDNSTPGNP